MPQSFAHLRLFNAADDPVGDLWEFDEFTWSRSRKPDPDSATVTVRANTTSAALLDADFLFARVVRNGVQQPRVLVLDETEDDDRHPDGDARPVRATFVGVEKWLENAAVYPENVKTTETGALTQDDSTNGNPLVLGHRFADANAGTIMRTLILRAKQRGTGALTRISIDFNGTTDSNGAAWVADDEMDETYTVGTSYKAVLDSLAGINWCHYHFDDFTLQLFRPDTLGSDKAGVVLRRGQYVTAAPRRKRRLDVKTAMLVAGEQQALYERVDAARVAEAGRREGFYQRGGVYQLGTITKLARLALDAQKNVTESLTVTVDPVDCPYEPGTDFDLWDRIFYDGVPGEPLRVNTITETWNQSGAVTLEMELLDRLTDNADRLTKLLERVQQPNAPDAKLPGRIDPIPTIPPSDDDYWNDWNSTFNDYLGGGGGGGYFGMVYIQPNEPEGVGKGTFWFDTDDYSV